MYTVLGSVLGFRASPFVPPPVGRTTFLGDGGSDSRPRVIRRARGAFFPQRSHFPRSWRNLRLHGSDSRSRSPLSIRALRSARNARIRLLTNIVSNIVSKWSVIFPVQSCPLARLVQDDGSRKLPQITNTPLFRRLFRKDDPLLHFVQ